MKFRIAHISPPGSKNNKSYQNYNEEKKQSDNMIWDDDDKNTLISGDFMIFYCWGEKVEIHKIINVSKDFTKRREWWDYKEHNVLYLSPILNTYSFKDFSKFNPPYSKYKKGFRNNSSYELTKWPELEKELNNNPLYNISVEKIEVMSVKPELIVESDSEKEIEENLDEQERELARQMEELRRRKARKVLVAKMPEIRAKRVSELDAEEEVLRQRIKAIEEDMMAIGAERVAVLNGKNDEILIAMELHKNLQI